MSTTPKETHCHHCGQRIVWNVTYPDKSNSHWAHAILVHHGKAHSVENALMDQQCPDKRHWATPRRVYHTPTPLDTLKPQEERPGLNALDSMPTPEASSNATLEAFHQHLKANPGLARKLGSPEVVETLKALEDWPTEPPALISPVHTSHY